MPVLNPQVSRWASQHHGVITAEDALARGCTIDQLRRAVDRGELTPAHRNVFRVSAAPRTWEQRTLVAVRAAGPGALASHRSAATLWGLDGSTRGRSEIVAPRHLRSWANDLARCHESKDLHLAQPATRLSIPCTGLCRTLIDLGAVLPIEPVQAAIDDAVRRDLCSWDDLLHTLAQHSKKGRRGAGPLRAILEECYGSKVPDSRFNRLVQRLIVDSGLQRPVIEHPILDARGRFVGRVDLAYPGLRIAIELDGRRPHLSAKAFEADRPRQNQLELLGWIVLRYTWRAYIHGPHKILTEVAAAIQCRMT